MQMVTLKRLMTFAGIAVLGLALAACSREITNVEQVVAGPQACFECHGDTSTALVRATLQWENSRHASGRTLNENDGSCKGCHTSEGFVARATGTTAPDVIADATPIHCFTCHAPHTNGDFRLRWTKIATLQNGTTYNLNSGNLCVACHQSRRNIKTYIAAAPTRTKLSERFGPHHGPQGDMLIGSNGYEYAGYTYSRTEHRAATTANGKDGCLECHFRVTDRLVVGGHSFNMEADEDGQTILNTGACTPCHGEIKDFNDVDGVQDEVDGLLTDLEARLTTAGLMADGAATEDSTSADSAGAVWNLLIAKEDRSHGVHNAQYILGLLESSIQYISGTRPQNGTLARAQRAMSGAKNRR